MTGPTPCPLEAEVQRRVRLELAELYTRTLDKVRTLEQQNEVYLARAYRRAASDLFAAEQGVR